jgi:hypothetical protein
MEEVPMTAEGHSAMLDEIKHLKTVERPRIIRQTAMLQKVPDYTTLPGILAVTKAIAAERAGKLDVRSLQDYA